MRTRLPLGVAGALVVLLTLALLFNSEVLVARGFGRATPVAPPADASWRQRARAQGYVYAYHGGTVQFPMLGLSERLHPSCPGGVDSPPYVTVKDGGRLGNLIMEYVSVWALAKVYNLGAFVPDRLLKRLKSVFAGLSVPDWRAVVGEDSMCLAKMMEAGETADDLDGRNMDPWGPVEPVDLQKEPLADAVRRARLQRAIIQLEICSLLPEAVVPVAAELKKELVFQPLLHKSAQAELRRLRKVHFPDFDGQVVYGAVHARRTDYHAQLELLYNVTQPAGVPFFVSAAAWLRRRLQPHERMLLVVSSDDAIWAQEELVPALRAAGEADRVGGGWAASWAGSGDPLRPERDLALLAACNHSIFAYGTFGLSAALIAGGHTVVYQLAREPLHPTLLTPSEQFARHLHGWVALR